MIDLSDQHSSDLCVLAAQRRVSQAQIVREAIAAYLSTRKPLLAFGAWRRAASATDDALRQQQAWRAEWDR